MSKVLATGLPVILKTSKQRKSKLDWCIFLCFGCLAAKFAAQLDCFIQCNWVLLSIYRLLPVLHVNSQWLNGSSFIVLLSSDHPPFLGSPGDKICNTIPTQSSQRKEYTPLHVYSNCPLARHCLYISLCLHKKSRKRLYWI